MLRKTDEIFQYFYKTDPLYDALWKSDVTWRTLKTNIILEVLESSLQGSYNGYFVEGKIFKKSVLTFSFLSKSPRHNLCFAMFAMKF